MSKDLVIVGLLGGIASGKSTVAREFERLGAVVLDADRMAHRCLGREEVIERIVGEFGREVLGEDGRIHKAGLARQAFRDEESRRKLESIVHPCVRRSIEERLDQLEATGQRTLVILDVPLLLESDLNQLCKKRIFIDTPFHVRDRRAREERGWSTGELERREKFQKPTEYKRTVADYMIENTGSLEPVRSRVRELFHEIVATPH